jgi:hypothetical protein
MSSIYAQYPVLVDGIVIVGSIVVGGIVIVGAIVYGAAHDISSVTVHEPVHEPEQELSISEECDEIPKEPRFSPKETAHWDQISRELLEDHKAAFEILSVKDKQGDSSARRTFVDRFGFALLCQKAVERIVSNTCGDFLAIGAGVSAWETLLRSVAAHYNRALIATDMEIQRQSFMPVEKLTSVKAVEKYGAACDTCFFSWPDYNNPHTLRALMTRHEPFPYVVYIGEGKGGCTGDDGLHEYLNTRYSCIEQILIPRWPRVNDFVEIFKRKDELENKTDDESEDESEDETDDESEDETDDETDDKTDDELEN